MKYEHFKMGGRWGRYTCRCSAGTATPEGEKGTDLACRCAFPVSVISCRTSSCFIHVWKRSLCLWRGREPQTCKVRMPAKKKHKYKEDPCRIIRSASWLTIRVQVCGELYRRNQCQRVPCLTKRSQRLTLLDAYRYETVPGNCIIYTR